MLGDKPKLLRISLYLVHYGKKFLFGRYINHSDCGKIYIHLDIAVTA